MDISKEQFAYIFSWWLAGVFGEKFLREWPTKEKIDYMIDEYNTVDYDLDLDIPRDVFVFAWMCYLNNNGFLTPELEAEFENLM